MSTFITHIDVSDVKDLQLRTLRGSKGTQFVKVESFYQVFFYFILFNASKK